MTAEQLLTDRAPRERRAGASRTASSRSSGPASRSSPRRPRRSRGTSTRRCSARAPETRDLFPVNMEVQRSRLLARAGARRADGGPARTSSCRSSSSSAATTASSACSPSTTTPSGPRCSAPSREFAGPAWTPEVEKAWTDAYGTVAGAMRTAAAGRARAGDLAGPGRRAPPVGWDLAVIEVAGQRADPLPGRAVRQRRDPAAPAAVALPLAGERAARRRTAGVPRPGGAGGLGQPRRSWRTRASGTPGGSDRRWAAAHRAATTAGTC